MHSVQNKSLCMYIVVLLCIVYKTLTIFIFFILGKKKKQLATCHVDTWLTYGHVPKLHMAIRPRTLEQVATWPHVNNPRGHVGMCNKYMRPNGHMYLIHVATRTCALIQVAVRTHVLIHVTERLPGHVATVIAIVATWRITNFFVVLSRVRIAYISHC